MLRVFGDRLVDENDTNWLYNILRECVRSHFRENFDALLEHLGRTDGKVRYVMLFYVTTWFSEFDYDNNFDLLFDPRSRWRV